MKKLRSRDIVFRKPLIFHVSENTKNDLKYRIYLPDVDASKYTLYASTYITTSEQSHTKTHATNLTTHIYFYAFSHLFPYCRFHSIRFARIR